jgi:hypothetical protein
MDIAFACAAASAVLGGFVGFLLRPSVVLIGQLPFGTVISRGRNLTGFDMLLKGAAEQSLNYLLAGAIIGAFVGTVIGSVIAYRHSERR